MTEGLYLPGRNDRAKLMRLDTAVILKRFFFVERSLIITQAGWLASIAPLEVKTTLPRLIWEDSMTADALRQRVFELRYPSRLMEIEADEPLIQLLEQARNAPSALAMVSSLTEVFKPALLNAYNAYLGIADIIGDGPSIRFMQQALRDKEQQIETLNEFVEQLRDADPDAIPATEEWVRSLVGHLDALGGIGLEPVESSGPSVHLPGSTPWALAQIPARDERFIRLRYYWPDVIDPNYPYGEGLSLQLRSAISHLNEVWAVETGGAILNAFANELGWEFIYDAARWTYDESRHCRMGYERLRQWGFTPQELPLGTYIYDAARNQEPIYRLGMLFFFETKNIHHKPARTKKFAEYSDVTSQHDMDFDWADETIHASYGNRWLGELLKSQGESDPDPREIRKRCGELVNAVVAQATDADRAQIRAIADAILAKAERIAVPA
jgi:hypothetical protein